MSACPACGRQVSILKIRRGTFNCPHCGSPIRSKNLTVWYVLFRLLAGGVAITFAAPFTGCAPCFYGAIVLIVAIIAYFTIKAIPLERAG